jgi:hypothetical protein
MATVIKTYGLFIDPVAWHTSTLTTVVNIKLSKTVIVLNIAVSNLIIRSPFISFY